MGFHPWLDHLVYATPDLAESVRDIEGRLGVIVTPGGKHVGWGTENALVGLGAGRYLEIIGPDASAPTPARPRSFGIDTLRAPALVTWAIAVHDLDAAVARARAAGHDPGDPRDGARTREDGTVLRWRLALKPAPWTGDGLVPFLIQWGSGTEHPSASLEHGCDLVRLHATHPSPGRVARMLETLGVSLDLEAGDRARLVAEVRSPAGVISLR